MDLYCDRKNIKFKNLTHFFSDFWVFKAKVASNGRSWNIFRYGAEKSPIRSRVLWRRELFPEMKENVHFFLVLRLNISCYFIVSISLFLLTRINRRYNFLISFCLNFLATFLFLFQCMCLLNRCAPGQWATF